MTTSAAFDLDMLFAKQRAVEGWGVDVRAYQVGEQSIVSLLSEKKLPLKTFKLPDDMILDILSCCSIPDCPFVWQEEGSVYYVAILVQQFDILFVLGPITSTFLTAEETELYQVKNGILDKQYRVPYLTATQMMNCASVICFLLTKNVYDFDTILIVNPTIADLYYTNTIEYLIDYPDRHRLSYEVEQEWCERIARGESYVDYKKINEVALADNVGQMAQSINKQAEYTFASALTLMSRAAVKGGIPPEESYALSDVFFQELARCKSVLEMRYVYARAMGTFTAHINRRRQQGNENDHISLCKDYIEKNLYEKISVAQIARELFISTGYLSHSFKAKTGVSVSRYIRERRLERGAELLRHTLMEISDIASRLTFHSQSHFGMLFKEQYEMTPSKYRIKFGVRGAKEKH